MSKKYNTYEEYMQLSLDELKKIMSEKQLKFADNYIINNNATESARIAEYSEKTCRQMGSENLAKPYIKAYIDKQLSKMQSKRIADATEVLEFFSSVMRGEIKDAFDLDPTLSDRLSGAKELAKRYRFGEKIEVDSDKDKENKVLSEIKNIVNNRFGGKDD